MLLVKSFFLVNSNVEGSVHSCACDFLFKHFQLGHELHGCFFILCSQFPWIRQALCAGICHCHGCFKVCGSPAHDVSWHATPHQV